jgi:transcriptional regulator with PAS, ATPase and Fis domain
VEKEWQTQRENQELKAQLKEKFKVHFIVSHSRQMEEALNMVGRVAGSSATVMILGESGTGKELIARAIHYASPRAERPLIKVNCAALPENLLESELFGHEKGAFTDARSQKKGMFEVADGGTLFLDEISEMNLGMQAKLLRVLEGQSFRRVGGVKNITVDLRVIAASNRNLEDAVRSSRFRQDLYFRLAIIPLTLLPLRDHKDDIPPLLDHFIRYYNDKFHKNIQGVTKEAEELLMNYDWPGNIRELRNAIERVMILAEGNRVAVKYLPIRISEGGILPVPMSEEAVGNGIHFPQGGISLYQVERELIRQALEHSRGNKTTAARLLQITRDTLRYKVKKYHLE